MEESLYRFQNLDHRSPKAYPIGAQVCVGHPNNMPAYMKPYHYAASPNGPSPLFVSTGLSQLRANQPDDSGSWFYSLPPFRQAFGPLLSSVPEEKKLPVETIGKNEGHENMTLGTGQKQYLVFDQSGDHTTLLYSSGTGPPIPPLNAWNQAIPASCTWLKGGPVAKGDSVSPLEPFLAEELDDHEKDGVESDMHEDTEELNALLYSDDDYSEDEEETSTGHSPSTMTAHRVQSLFDAEGRELSSCAGTAKRKKLLDGGYSTPSAIVEAELVDTASSLKCASRHNSDNDAESYCGNSDDQFSEGFDSFSGKKRSRTANIRDTIRLLQKVVPDGQGKDTMDIIDEAIDYLKSLKAKAKDLGLDAL